MTRTPLKALPPAESGEGAQREEPAKPQASCNLKHSEIQLGKAAALTGTYHVGESGPATFPASHGSQRQESAAALSDGLRKGSTWFLTSVTLQNSCAHVPWAEGPDTEGFSLTWAPGLLFTRN